MKLITESRRKLHKTILRHN